MRITTLRTAGVKSAQTSTHSLAPVTVITGDNFAGKTARLDALRLGLIGYLPELGKRPGDTFTLAANGEMSVGLTFDDGSVISRGWRRERGSVKATSNCAMEIPTVLVDPNEYFELGDKDRVRYVFKLAAAHVEGAADAVISKLKGIKIEGHGPQHEAVICDLVNLVDETDRARHEADKPVPQWLEELIAVCRERLKASKAKADWIAKTVVGMAVIDCEDDEATAKNVSRELEVKRAQEAALHQQIGKMQAELSNLESVAARRRYLEARIISTGTAGPTVGDLEAKLAALKPKTEEARQTNAALMAQSEARSREAIARAARNTASKAIETLWDELEEKKLLEQCPFCGAKGEGWLDHLVAEYEQKIAASKALCDEKEAALAKAIRALSAAETSATQAKEHDAQIDAACKDLAAVNVALANRKAEQQQAESAREQLALLPDTDPEQALQQLTETRKNSEALRSEIDALAARRDKYIQQQQSAVLSAKAAQQAEQVKATVAVESEAVSLLESLQVEMVKRAFDAIMDTANRLTDGILKSRLEYKNGEIGRWEDGVWISHHSFSGTEKALAYAGISVALAAQSPVKIVLLDEMGRLTAENKVRVVDRLLALIEGRVIDQAVLVDVSKRDYSASKYPDEMVSFLAV